MSDFLQELYAAKERALREDEARESYADLAARAERRRSERRSFSAALRAANGPAVIAEIKRASPSKGVIARDFDAATIARKYEAAGADAVSVITEADHFLGNLGYLDIARAETTRPLLRKDFLSTPYQVAQSAAYGADALLLIVAGLTDVALRALTAEATRFGLDVLVEVHDEDELVRALTLAPSAIGINNRDLRTFRTDLAVTERLLPFIPRGTLIISESGLQSAQDAARLYARGAAGFLIGESLMRAEDPALLIRELRAAVVGS